MASTLATPIAQAVISLFDGNLGKLLNYGYRPGYGILGATLTEWTPADLFLLGEQGAWYDPSDLTTMFQDAAGTTPVTAAEQPVGLILDKHQSDGRGIVNRIRNNTMVGAVAGTPGTLPTNWVKSTAGLEPSIVGVGVENGINYIDFRFAGTPSAITAQTITFESPSLVITVGETWTSSAFVKLVSGGLTNTSVISLRLMDEPGATNFTPGATLTRIVNVRTSTSTSANTRLRWSYIDTVTPVDFTLRIGLPQLELGSVATAPQLNSGAVGGPGNHATQTTATKRPVLSQRVNLLTNTEDFGGAAWNLGGTTVTANTDIAPDGTTTADTILSGGAQAIYQSVPTTSGVAYRVSVSIKKTTGATVYPMVSMSGSSMYGQVILNTNTGIATVRIDIPGATSITSVSQGDFWLVAFTLATDATLLDFRIYPSVSTDGSSISGGLSGSCVVWGASLVPADQASLPYQRVNTATDYDTVGFPKFSNYDAIDDVLDTTFASALGSSCTVARAVVGQPPVILTNQTIGTSYATTTDNAGLLVINRALTPAETASLTTYLTAKGAA